MEPFYKNNNYTLYLGDCIQTMDLLIQQQKKFNLIFADPPYFLSNGGTSMHSGKRVKVDKGLWDKSKGFKEDYEFTHKWISCCHQLLTDDGVIWISGTFHNIHIVGFVLQRLGFKILNEISWLKPNAPPNLACRSFAHAHETLLWARKNNRSKHTFNYELMKRWDQSNDVLKSPDRQMRSVWSIPLTPQQEKKFGKHPTQKPQELLRRVILSSSNPKDLILDPFCGSGTTGVVAVCYGRHFIGIDETKSFLQLAQKRITAAQNNNDSNFASMGSPLFEQISI